MNETTVRFVQGGSGVLSLLEIDTGQGPGALGRLAEALFDLRVQIVRAESRLVEGRTVERLWVVEFDGAPIRPHRRLDIQVSVLRAIESAALGGYLTSSRRAPSRTRSGTPPTAA
jgi:UTP:GlnB (protein PII) uridylyltransferase